RRKACDLIKGKVPGHNTKQGAERQPPNHSFASGISRNFLVRCKRGAVVGIILEDLRSEFGFLDSLSERFPHFFGDDFTEVVLSCIEKLCCFRNDFRALRNFVLAPFVCCILGRVQNIFNFFPSRGWEGFNDFVCGWVLYSVGHGGKLLSLVCYRPFCQSKPCRAVDFYFVANSLLCSSGEVVSDGFIMVVEN